MYSPMVISAMVLSSSKRCLKFLLWTYARLYEVLQEAENRETPIFFILHVTHNATYALPAM